MSMQCTGKKVWSFTSTFIQISLTTRLGIWCVSERHCTWWKRQKYPAGNPILDMKIMADSATTELRRSYDKRQLHSCLFQIVRSQCGQCAGQNETQSYWVALRHSRNCRTLQNHRAAPAMRQARTVAFTSTCTKCGYLKTARTNVRRRSRGLERKRRHKTSCGPTCDHHRIWYSSSPKQGLTFYCPNK